VIAIISCTLLNSIQGPIGNFSCACGTYRSEVVTFTSGPHDKNYTGANCQYDDNKNCNKAGVVKANGTCDCFVLDFIGGGNVSPDCILSHSLL